MDSTTLKPACRHRVSITERFFPDEFRSQNRIIIVDNWLLQLCQLASSSIFFPGFLRFQPTGKVLQPGQQAAETIRMGQWPAVRGKPKPGLLVVA
jgi:hypothetical protein